MFPSAAFSTRLPIRGSRPDEWSPEVEILAALVRSCGTGGVFVIPCRLSC